VLPSIEREGLPKALLEAMSVGVAPIATRVGGMPEVVEDGVNGLVVAPADSAALVAAIVKMASDGGARAKYAAAAFETIRTKFTVERSVEKTLNLYRELL
jgi:glycosyltransferase involved in cell wall biosynthesis